MPIETDCSNLIKHIQDASEGLARRIKATEEELDTLKILRDRKKSLMDKIENLQREIDDYMDDVGGII